MLLGAPGGSYTALPADGAARRAGRGRSRRRRAGSSSSVSARPGNPARAVQPGREIVSVAGPPSSRRHGDRRSAHQRVRHRRRDRAALRTAPPEADHRVAARPLRPRRGGGRRSRAHHLAERRPPGGVRHEGRPDGHGDAAPQGIVPVALRVERARDVVRDRSHLAVAAGAPHQRPGDGRHADDRGLGQGPRRSARAARRRLRSPHHGGAVGNALLRSRLAAGRRSSGRHRDLRRRAVRGAAAEAAGRPDRAGPARSRRCGTTGAATSRISPPRATRATSTSPAAGRIRASRARTSWRWSCRTTAPRAGPLWLVAHGWIHPTDSSINVAIAQGTHAAPEGLSLHVADAGGRFREVRKGLGFPSGKDKTILVDLTGLFGATGPRRLRLATNLEIFWDRLGWAIGRPDVEVHPRRLDLLSADLSYRGYSVTEQPAPAFRSARATRWRERPRGGAISRATTRASATCGICCGRWTIGTSS